LPDHRGCGHNGVTSCEDLFRLLDQRRRHRCREVNSEHLPEKRLQDIRVEDLADALAVDELLVQLVKPID
jgi:hypothetical protein